MKRTEVWVAAALVAVTGMTLYPSLVRSRGNTNVAQAIGDTRTVISSNQTYASTNCGLFAEDLVCMTREHGPICIPDYPENAPEFIGSDLGRPSPYVKAGYEREYQGFDAAEEIEPRCAPRSPRYACYASRPSLPPSTGTRSFVGIMSGEILEDPFGGDTRCVPIVTARGPSFGPPENAHGIDSAFVLDVHAAEARKGELLLLGLCFLPAFAAVFLLSLLKRAVESSWLLAIFGFAFVNAAIFAQVLLVFLVPTAIATAIAPKSRLTTPKAWGHLVLAAISISILARFVLAGLIRH